MHKLPMSSIGFEALLSAFLCFSVLGSESRAESCKGTADVWLEEIERFSRGGDTLELIRPVLCLSQKADYYAENYDEFIESGVMNKIEAETEKNRLRVIRLLVPLTHSSQEELRQAAIAALAYYGYHPSGDMMDSYPDGAKKAVLFAIVGYRNAMVWAFDEFDFLDRNRDLNIEVKIIGKMACLNLLYYLAQPQCLEFIDSVLLRHEPQVVRGRALMVKDRVYRLHPELK